MANQKRNFDEDRRMCDAATAGPWTWVPGKREYQDNGTIRSELEGDVCDFGNYARYYPTAGTEPFETDIVFIAEARTGWPAALDEIRRQAAEIQRYRQALEFYAAESTYDIGHLDKHGYIVIDEDGGNRAREALAYGV